VTLTPTLSQKARESNFPPLSLGEGTGVRGIYWLWFQNPIKAGLQVTYRSKHDEPK